MISETELNSFHEKNKISTADLLIAEKKRRGYSKDKLTFLGMANIAKYYWCAQKSLFESLEKEELFFSSYLSDRISATFRKTIVKNIENPRLWNSKYKSFLKSLPKDENEFLEVISEVKFDYVNKLFLEEIDFEYSISRSLDPSKKKKEISKVKKIYEDEEPMIKGKVYHSLIQKDYLSFRWNFEWDKYVFIGIPDGLTENKVYEFKTTENKFLSFFQKPVLQAQADLYGYFFKRNIKETELYIINDDKIESKEEEVDKKNAKKILRKFRALENGEPPLAPKKWKCKNCKYEKECPIYRID